LAGGVFPAGSSTGELEDGEGQRGGARQRSGRSAGELNGGARRRRGSCVADLRRAREKSGVRAERTRKREAEGEEHVDFGLCRDFHKVCIAK
jgi:hypothetical protein